MIDILGDLEDLTIEDVAAGLSKVTRFNGQLEQPINVAQHSLLVASVVADLLYENDPSITWEEIHRYQRYALLHDAHEMLIGDVPSPVKEALKRFGTAWEALETRLQLTMLHRFEVPFDVNVNSLTHQADLIVRGMEFETGATDKQWEALGLPTDQPWRPVRYFTPFDLQQSYTAFVELWRLINE